MDLFLLLKARSGKIIIDLVTPPLLTTADQFATD